jgi:hypothetical protein
VNKLQHIVRSNWCRSGMNQGPLNSSLLLLLIILKNTDEPDQIIPNTVLREKYIPEMVLNLHQILYHTHDLLPG